MKLSSNGVLSGTPSKSVTAGPSSVTVKVTETVTTLNGKKKKKKVKIKTTAQTTDLIVLDSQRSGGSRRTTLRGGWGIVRAKPSSPE